MNGRYRSFFSTALGVGIVHASERGITRLDLPDVNREEMVECEHSVLTEQASELLCSYYSGERIEFDALPVDLPGISPFRLKALTAIRSIPYGMVRSYSQIASDCGAPRAARAIGGAMASNPVPVIIPCHRVVGSCGRLTGFSAPGGKQMKQLLLEMEGVEFKGLLVMKKLLVMNR